MSSGGAELRRFVRVSSEFRPRELCGGRVACHVSRCRVVCTVVLRCFVCVVSCGVAVLGRCVCAIKNPSFPRAAILWGLSFIFRCRDPCAATAVTCLTSFAGGCYCLPRPPTRCPAAMPPSRRGSGRPGALHPLLLLGLLVGRAASILSYSAEEELAADLEAPGVLAGAALRLATAHNEVVFVVTGPDATSMQMANNSLVTLAGVGLRRHTMMMADSWDTCKQMGVMVTDHRHSNLGPTDLQRRPADSVLAPHCALPALRVLLELTRAQGPADPTRREYR